MGGPHAVERRAVLKILLHAIKYPSYTVNGVLLGSIKDGVVSVSDAVPLVHTFTTLVPTFETALFQACAGGAEGGGLDLWGWPRSHGIPPSRAAARVTPARPCPQVDAHCKTVPGLGVVGYYQVNSKPADAQLSGTGRNFASKVAALHPGSIALVVRWRGPGADEARALVVCLSAGLVGWVGGGLFCEAHVVLRARAHACVCVQERGARPSAWCPAVLGAGTPTACLTALPCSWTARAWSGCWRRKLLGSRAAGLRLRCSGCSRGRGGGPSPSRHRACRCPARGCSPSWSS